MGRSGAKNKAACYSGLPPAQRPKRFDELESHAPMAKSIYSYSEESSSVISEENNNIEKSRLFPDGKGKDAGDPEC